ncbi:hypothetical protein Tco_0532612 [Tanacetum coccineum]
MGYYFYFPPKNKIVVAGYAEFFEKNLITQKGWIISKHVVNIPSKERLDLNKTQGASTPEEVKRMQNVPYASVVRSIINTKDMFLVYGGNPEAELRVDCYCDAGFETDRDDIKCQTGYVFILNGGAVDCKSSKQSTTAMSATEGEYIVASEATMEAI